MAQVIIIRNKVVNVEIAFINSSLGYDKMDKTVFGVNLGLDGNSEGWEDLKQV